MNPVFTATMDGDLPSIKNRRRIIPARGARGPMVIKSAEALAYETLFLAKIRPPATPYEGTVSLRARVWYSSRRRDLDIEMLCDLLQKAGVLKNDRQIIHKECWRGLDRERPRIHFSIYPANEEATHV